VQHAAGHRLQRGPGSVRPFPGHRPALAEDPLAQPLGGRALRVEREHALDRFLGALLLAVPAPCLAQVERELDVELVEPIERLLSRLGPLQIQVEAGDGAQPGVPARGGVGRSDLLGGVLLSHLPLGDQRDREVLLADPVVGTAGGLIGSSVVTDDQGEGLKAEQPERAITDELTQPLGQ